MENKQDKEKKSRKQIKVAVRDLDLKPSKDVKGGYLNYRPR
jgi:hypothetical protein